jgi:hypothetical protein
MTPFGVPVLPLVKIMHAVSSGSTHGSESDGTDATDGSDATDEIDATDATDGMEDSDGSDGSDETDGIDESDESDEIAERLALDLADGISVMCSTWRMPSGTTNCSVVVLIMTGLSTVLHTYFIISGDHVLRSIGTKHPPDFRIARIAMMLKLP